MTTLGFTNAGGEFDDFSSSASSDYSSIVSDTAHTEDVGASWAWEDEEGELGTQHRYSRTVNNQSGSQTLHHQSDFGFTNSRTDGYDFHIDRHLIFTVDWIHHDSATSNDGDVTRSVFDERTTDHTGQYDRERHGGSRGMIATEYTTLSGGSTVSVETITRGGYLYSTGGVGNPDTITQHYSEDGWWNVVDSFAYDDDSMAPYTWDATNTGTIVNEYQNDYSRPEPQEGSGAGGGEDDGLDFTVLQYLWTNQLHSFLMDADGEYASVESETESSRTLTGDNAYLATSHTDYTATPHPSEGGGGSGGGSGGGGGEAEPVTWSESSSEEGTFESPGWPINSFDTTERAFVYFGLTNGWDLDMPEDGRTAAPTLESTFSNTLSGPAAAAGLRDGAAHTKAYDTDKPVQDDVPPAGTPDVDQETEGDGDGCGCGCGEYIDVTGDEVGTESEIDGQEVVIRGGVTRLRTSVERYDKQINRGATQADWDRFFGIGEGNEPYEGMDKDEFIRLRYLPIVRSIKPLKEAIAGATNGADRRAFEVQLAIRLEQLAVWDEQLGNPNASDSLIRTINLLAQEDPAAAAVAPFVTSVAGLVQAGAGLAETAGGVYGVIQTGGWGAWAGAGWLVVNGIDNTQAGLRQWWTGEATTSVTQQGLQKVFPGYSAPLAEALIGFGATGLATGAFKSATQGATKAAVESLDDAGKPAVNALGEAREATCRTAKEVFVDSSKYPESLQHLEDAGALNRPLTINRKGAAANRADALRGRPKVSGRDLDEAPPAVLRQPGDSVSVRDILRSDNRGSGSSIGNQIRNLPDGSQVILRPKRGI